MAFQNLRRQFLLQRLRLDHLELFQVTHPNQRQDPQEKRRSYLIIVFFLLRLQNSIHRK